MRGTRNSSEESEMGDESTSVELSQVWVESKAKHAWKRSSRRSILFGLRIELRLAADKQQLQMKQMSRALAQLPQIRIRIANCSAWEGGGVARGSTTSSATQNLQNSFMQMKWLLWRRLLSMHTRGNAKRRQEREREKDRWEREWGREKRKEAK